MRAQQELTVSRVLPKEAQFPAHHPQHSPGHQQPKYQCHSAASTSGRAGAAAAVDMLTPAPANARKALLALPEIAVLRIPNDSSLAELAQFLKATQQAKLS